jgi:hypothetical protein
MMATNKGVVTVTLRSDTAKPITLESSGPSILVSGCKKI